MTHPDIHVFENISDLHEALGRRFRQDMLQSDLFNIVLAGGGTPAAFYRHLAERSLAEQWDWDHVHVFWGDERCVPPGHEDSNYRMAYESLLRYIPIPADHIHRIPGELKPEDGRRVYDRAVRKHFDTVSDGRPVFDWVLLGIGTDGHTASLFPGTEFHVEKGRVCVLAHHPESGQPRISLSLEVLNRSKYIAFLAAGTSKAEVIQELLTTNRNDHLPAAWIDPREGRLEWYLDSGAAAFLPDGFRRSTTQSD